MFDHSDMGEPFEKDCPAQRTGLIEVGNSEDVFRNAFVSWLMLFIGKFRECATHIMDASYMPQLNLNQSVALLKSLEAVDLDQTHIDGKDYFARDRLIVGLVIFGLIAMNVSSMIPVVRSSRFRRFLSTMNDSYRRASKVLSLCLLISLVLALSSMTSLAFLHYRSIQKMAGGDSQLSLALRNKIIEVNEQNDKRADCFYQRFVAKKFSEVKHELDDRIDWINGNWTREWIPAGSERFNEDKFRSAISGNISEAQALKKVVGTVPKSDRTKQHERFELFVDELITTYRVLLEETDQIAAFSHNKSEADQKYYYAQKEELVIPLHDLRDRIAKMKRITRAEISETAEVAKEWNQWAMKILDNALVYNQKFHKFYEAGTPGNIFVFGVVVPIILFLVFLLKLMINSLNEYSDHHRTNLHTAAAVGMLSLAATYGLTTVYIFTETSQISRVCHNLGGGSYPSSFYSHMLPAGTHPKLASRIYEFTPYRMPEEVRLSMDYYDVSGENMYTVLGQMIKSVVDFARFEKELLEIASGIDWNITLTRPAKALATVLEVERHIYDRLFGLANPTMEDQKWPRNTSVFSLLGRDRNKFELSQFEILDQLKGLVSYNYEKQIELFPAKIPQIADDISYGYMAMIVNEYTQIWHGLSNKVIPAESLRVNHANAVTMLCYHTRPHFNALWLSIGMLSIFLALSSIYVLAANNNENNRTDSMMQYTQVNPSKGDDITIVIPSFSNPLIKLEPPLS